MHWLVIGSGLGALVSVAYGMWLPTILVRVHGLPLGKAGMLVALIGTTSAVAGGLLSGRLSTALTQWNPLWRLGTPIMSLALSVPCAAAVFLWPVGWELDGIPLAMVFAGLFGFINAFWMPAVFTTMSLVVPPDKRALANGLLALANTWIGVGLGPFIVGLLSDAIQPSVGPQALRYALVGTMGFGLVSAWSFRRAQDALPSRGASTESVFRLN